MNTTCPFCGASLDSKWISGKEGMRAKGSTDPVGKRWHCGNIERVDGIYVESVECIKRQFRVVKERAERAELIVEKLVSRGMTLNYDPNGRDSISCPICDDSGSWTGRVKAGEPVPEDCETHLSWCNVPGNWDLYDKIKHEDWCPHHDDKETPKPD